MSAFADLEAGLASALSALAGGRVYRGHAWLMPETTDSMVFVRVENATREVTGIAAGPVDWRTQVAVEIRARYAPDTQAPTAAVDSLLASVCAALAAYQAAGVQQVMPGVVIRWEYFEAEVNLIGVTLMCDVLHRTQTMTLTAWT